MKFKTYNMVGKVFHIIKEGGTMYIKWVAENVIEL
jgi:hypothetical protein